MKWNQNRAGIGRPSTSTGCVKDCIYIDRSWFCVAAVVAATDIVVLEPVCLAHRRPNRSEEKARRSFIFFWPILFRPCNIGFWTGLILALLTRTQTEIRLASCTPQPSHIFKFAGYPTWLDYMSIGRMQNQRTVNDSVHRPFGLPPARGATVRWAGRGDIVSPRCLSSNQQMQ